MYRQFFLFFQNSGKDCRFFNILENNLIFLWHTDKKDTFTYLNNLQITLDFF